MSLKLQCSMLDIAVEILEIKVDTFHSEMSHFNDMYLVELVF